MSSSRKTVAIVGGTLWGNRGAEAMLVTTIGRIREQQPDTQFLVFSYYPRRDRELCNDPAIEFHDYRPLNIGLKIFPLAVLAWLFRLIKIRLPGTLIGRELKALRKADLLCDIGGITFCDGRKIFLLYNVLSILPAMLLQVPVVKLSQAMGPFESRTNRFWASRILARCQKIFARGGRTAEHLYSLDLPAYSWQQAADVAFAYEDKFSLTNESRTQLEKFVARYVNRSQLGHQTVAVIPSSLVMKKNPLYISQIADLICDLAIAGHDILLLPNATRGGLDKSRNNDLQAIRHIVDHVRIHSPDVLNRLWHVDFDINTAGIRRLIRFADAVVTSRFHGMVAALADAIPVVVIGWSHKYAEVLAQFDCEELCCDHQDTADHLTEQVLHVLVCRSKWRERLQQHLPQVIESSRSQLDYVCQMLSPDQAENIKTRAEQWSSPQDVVTVG